MFIAYPGTSQGRALAKDKGKIKGPLLYHGPIYSPATAVATLTQWVPVATSINLHGTGATVLSLAPAAAPFTTVHGTTKTKWLFHGLPYCYGIRSAVYKAKLLGHVAFIVPDYTPLSYGTEPLSQVAMAYVVRLLDARMA